MCWIHIGGGRLQEERRQRKPGPHHVASWQVWCGRQELVENYTTSFASLSSIILLSL